MKTSASSPVPVIRRVPETSRVRGWKPLVEQPQLQSYAYHLPYASLRGKEDDKVYDDTQWVSSAQLDAWMEALHPSRYDSENGAAWTDAYYRGEKLLRKTAWISLDPICTCDYGYSDTWQTQATDPHLLEVVREMTRVIQNITGCTSLNCCNLNYYPQGGGVGWHADDEFLFDGRQRATCIVSLSLCRRRRGGAGKNNSDHQHGARKFLVQRQTDREETAPGEFSDESTCTTAILQHGDLLTMEGMFQKYYFHSVWPGDSQDYSSAAILTSNEKEIPPYIQGERINLTWRTIVQHLDGSNNECRGRICPLSTKN